MERDVIFPDERVFDVLMDEVEKHGLTYRQALCVLMEVAERLGNMNPLTDRARDKE